MSLTLDDRAIGRATGGEKVAWSRAVSRVRPQDGNVEFRQVLLTRKAMADLIAHFGWDWLMGHLDRVDRDLDVWQRRYWM